MEELFLVGKLAGSLQLYLKQHSSMGDFHVLKIVFKLSFRSVLNWVLSMT